MRVFLVFLLLLFSMASSFPQNGPVCPTDSLYNVSSCVIYFNHRMNWSQAQGMCQQHGLHLVTIQNLNEAFAIATLVKNYQQSENIWIKLENPGQNSQWKITDKLQNGQDGQEVIIKQKLCVELIAAEGFLKWNNTDCQERRPFLCQALSFHSELSTKKSTLTKLSKVTENDEKTRDYKLTKYNGEMREKCITKEDKNTKENFFTNGHSSEKSLSPFLMVSLLFISFLISQNQEP